MCGRRTQQPKAGAARAVERPGAGAGVGMADGTAAVGLERAHAQLLGQGQSLLVVGFGLRGIRRVSVGLDNTKLVQRERLVGTLFVLPGQVECLAGRCQAFSSRPARRQTSLSCATQRE